MGVCVLFEVGSNFVVLPTRRAVHQISPFVSPVASHDASVRSHCLPQLQPTVFCKLAHRGVWRAEDSGEHASISGLLDHINRAYSRESKKKKKKSMFKNLPWMEIDIQLFWWVLWLRPYFSKLKPGVRLPSQSHPWTEKTPASEEKTLSIVHFLSVPVLHRSRQETAEYMDSTLYPPPVEAVGCQRSC